MWPLLLLLLGSADPPTPSVSGTAAERPTLYVKTAEDLVSAIGSNRILRLSPGRYRLSDLEPSPGEHVRWKEVHDGFALVIHDVSQLDILGPPSGTAAIEVAPRYADVLTFERVERVRLEGVELGHAEGDGTCTGGVLRLEDASDVHVSRTVLHGSGIEALTLRNVRNSRFSEVEIHGTTERILSSQRSSNLHFENNRFVERHRGAGILDVRNSPGITFVENELAARLTATSSPADFFQLDAISVFGLEEFVLRDRITGVATVHNEILAASRKPAADPRLIQARIAVEGTGRVDRAAGDFGADTEEASVSVDIPDIGLFRVGTVLRVGGAEGFHGVDPESIVVRRLGGASDPILVAWTDYMQGMGAYQTAYYFVASPEDPPRRLLEGQLGLSGHSGWDYHGRAEVSFGWDQGVLERRVESYEWRALSEPAPLAHRQMIGSNWHYVAEIEKAIIDRWAYESGKLVPLDTRTFYRLQKGDELEAVAEYFDVEADKISGHEPWRPGAWVQVDR